MTIKDEISKIDSSRTEQLAELSAIVRNSGVVGKNIVITIENNSIARRIYKLFKEMYDVNISITVRRRYGLNNNLIYILSINSKCHDILTDLSIIDKKDNYLDIPNEYLISDNEDI